VSSYGDGGLRNWGLAAFTETGQGLGYICLVWEEALGIRGKAVEVEKTS